MKIWFQNRRMKWKREAEKCRPRADGGAGPPDGGGGPPDGGGGPTDGRDDVSGGRQPRGRSS